jgi:hypothetical protein
MIGRHTSSSEQYHSAVEQPISALPVNDYSTQ